MDFLGEQITQPRPLYTLDQRPEPVATPRTALSLEDYSAYSLGLRATFSWCRYLLFAPRRDGEPLPPFAETLDLNADAVRRVSLNGSDEFVIPSDSRGAARRDLPPYDAGCLPETPRRMSPDEHPQSVHVVGVATPLTLADVLRWTPEERKAMFAALRSPDDALPTPPSGHTTAEYPALRELLLKEMRAHLFHGSADAPGGEQWNYCRSLVVPPPTDNRDPATLAAPYDRWQLILGARYVGSGNTLTPAAFAWEVGLSFRIRRFGWFITASGNHFVSQNEDPVGNQRPVRPNFHELRATIGMQAAVRDFLGDGGAVLGLQASLSRIFWSTPVDVPGAVVNNTIYAYQFETTFFASLPASASSVFRGLVGVGFKIPYQPLDGGSIGFIPTLTVVPAASTSVAQRQ